MKLFLGGSGGSEKNGILFKNEKITSLLHKLFRVTGQRIALFISRKSQRRKLVHMDEDGNDNDYDVECNMCYKLISVHVLPLREH